MTLKIQMYPKEKRLIYSHNLCSWSVIEYEKNGSGQWRAGRVLETGLTGKQAKVLGRRGVRFGHPAPGGCGGES
jgi:hypothetical protein